MISFFRRIFASKIGLALTLGFVGLIAFAFATADVSSSGTFGGVTGSGTAAQVGEMKITTAELGQSVNAEFRQQQQQNTSLDLKTYVEQGGFESVLRRLTNSFAIAAFGQKHGISAGKRLVDSEIASIQAFQGADGQFSPENFRAALQAQGLKEQQLRDDFTRNLVAEQLLPLASVGISVPKNLATPYASLLLEARQGEVVIIPSAAFIGTEKPDAAAVSAFYKKNGSRYTIPERRSVSYALFDKTRFEGKIKPTDKEIEGFYKLNKDRFAASETRDLQQIIVPTEAAAKTLANKINGGTSMAAAAQTAGLSASTKNGVKKGELVASASQAVADAVFKAAKGKVAVPAQSSLGWHIVKVNDVRAVQGTPLAIARAQIASELTQGKMDEALAELTVTMEDEFASGSSLADIAKAEQLEIKTTPLLVASGRNPRDPDFKPAPEMQRILPLAFAVEEDSDPQVVEITPGQQYAIVGVREVKAAAPPPLESIKEQVTRDYQLDEGSKKAKVMADEISKKVSAGMTLAKALSETDVRLPPVQSIRSSRIDIARLQEEGQVPPPISLMFSMAEKTAKTLQAPQDQGWFVVSLDNIDPGDASTRPDLLAATEQNFAQVFGNEYAEQFINAMKADVTVERNESAITALKTQLTGTGN